MDIDLKYIKEINLFNDALRNMEIGMTDINDDDFTFFELSIYIFENSEIGKKLKIGVNCKIILPDNDQDKLTETHLNILGDVLGKSFVKCHKENNYSRDNVEENINIFLYDNSCEI